METSYRNRPVCELEYISPIDYSTAGDSRRLGTTQLPADPGLGK